ncbi:MAG: hypothetical protein OXT67_07640 [Zetaproteobacteria bacterium]|nr:hypothetical protein [Zetaproteobacteria bacterium]
MLYPPRRLRLTVFAIVTVTSSIICFSAHAKEQKKWLLTLPLFTSDREATIGLDVPFTDDASLAFHAISQSKGEALHPQEMEEVPHSHLYTSAKEATMLFQRFSNPALMRGIHWGLGVGYRSTNVTWVKEANPELVLIQPQLDTHGLAHHTFHLSGPTYTARAGYRYVATDVGFVAGIFLKLRHFQSTVKDLSGTSQPAPVKATSFVRGTLDDQRSLQRRLMTAGYLGLEVGWAF